MPEALHTSVYPSDHEIPSKNMNLPQNDVRERLGEKNAVKTTRECVEMFQESVDNARADAQRSLNSEPAGADLALKLTVDLREQNLSQIPKEVISIIKHDVARLHLSRNQLSHVCPEFIQLTNLQYLSLRENKFREIPKAILGLPQLEILDLSRNKLSEIPDEIENIKALRVFSIRNNNIQDLPISLGRISALRLMKLSGNPWNPKLQRIIDKNDDATSRSPNVQMDESMRDKLATDRLLVYLRYHAPPGDSGEESTSDGPLETPRALSRFPVHPQYGHSTSGSESASDLRSPQFMRPSGPLRSHTRIPSNQYGTLQNAMPRRPGLAPLALGNERNRSNSESILQSAQTTKTKRMGLIPKRAGDLSIVEETRTNRNSHHFRGQSHGSALRNGSRAGDSSPSGSPNGVDYQRPNMVRRLTSLPQQKRNARPISEVIEGARGILYSFHLLHPLFSTLAGVVKDGKIKRFNVDRIFESAAMRIDHLDHELHKFDSISDQTTDFAQPSTKDVAHATRDCILAHQEVASVLTRIVKHMVKDADPRYLRSSMLTLFNCINETHVVCQNLGINKLEAKPRPNIIQRVSTISELPGEGDHAYKSDRSVTPTQHRKPERRWGNRKTSQQSFGRTNTPTIIAQNTAPLYSNGRSRSNSLARPMYSSTSSSMVSTPRSSESFSSTYLGVRSRSGSINLAPEPTLVERQEEVQFDQIFSVLRNLVEEGLRGLPRLQTEFLRVITDMKDVDPRVRDQWTTFTDNTTQCLRLTEILKTHLSTVKLNDSEGQNVREFWQLAQECLKSYGDLLVVLIQATKIGILSSDWKPYLRSIHKLSKEAGTLIAGSPWHSLTLDVDPQATPHALPQTQPAIPSQRSYQHRPRGSGGSSTGGSSPYPSNVPATPLSAALGPAAQATIPAASEKGQVSAPPPTPANVMPPTPNTASLEDSFKGNIFQRADTYQQSFQQTMIPRRPII